MSRDPGGAVARESETPVGIDQIGIDVPGLCLSLRELARARGEDPDKLLAMLMQEERSVAQIEEQYLG